MTPFQIVLLILALLLLGIVVFPLINRRQFTKMPFEQQVRLLMKEAKGNDFFKNVSRGTHGILYYIKNKRKILFYPWELRDGVMRCTRQDLYTKWDYPGDAAPFTEEETAQAKKALSAYNEKARVRLELNDD